MQKSNIHSKKAFTLVEVLVVMFLALVIVVGAYAIYVISLKTYRQNTAQGELAQNARIALERMSRDIRQAVEIVTVLPLNPEEGAPANEIKFQDGHNLLPSGQIQYITFYLNGSDLYRKVSHYSFVSDPTTWVLYSAVDAGGNPPTESVDLDQIKAQNITSLEFWGTKDITIYLTVSDATNNYTFQTQTMGRNIQ